MPPIPASGSSDARALGAEDLAMEVAAVADVRDLAPGVRAMLDVIGHHAAERGLSHDGTPNQLGRELDELAEALALDDS